MKAAVAALERCESVNRHESTLPFRVAVHFPVAFAGALDG
jgi:hypothetical protein